MNEHDHLGDCGWPYLHFCESKEIELDGMNMAENEELWFEKNSMVGKVKLKGIDKSLNVYELNWPSKQVRVAMAEVSQSLHIIASNDVVITKLDGSVS